MDNFIEPFVGSGAVLLVRPHSPRVETVNDLDCHLCNVWRSLKHDPEGTAEYADDVVSEADLHSRHRWLVGVEHPEPTIPEKFVADPLASEAYLAGFLGEQRTYAAAFRKKIRSDPHYFDSKLAGWYLWGLCCWIGGGWCVDPDHGAVHGPVGGSGERGSRLGGNGSGPIQEGVHKGDGNHYVHAKGDGALGARVPFAHRPTGIGKGGNQRGVHADPPDSHRPQLADAYSRGRGVHNDNHLAQSRPTLVGGRTGDQYYGGTYINSDKAPSTCAQRRAWLLDWFGRLRDRLRTVRVCAGHWLRVCDSDSVTTRLGTTGIFMDPPYPTHHADGSKSRSDSLYATDGSRGALDVLRDEVLAYCLERGSNPKMRICVAYYSGDGYEVLKSHGWDEVAWAAQGGYSNRNKTNKNKSRERLIFSPHCVPAAQRGLFDQIEE